MMRKLVLFVGLLSGVACAPAKAPADVKGALTPAAVVEGTPLRAMAALPARSPASTIATRIAITNVGSSEVQWDWLGFDGELVRYATLAPRESVDQPTYAEHVWIITRDGQRLGWFAAPETPIDVVVH